MTWPRDRLTAGLRQIANASGAPYIGVALSIAGRRHETSATAGDTLDPSLIARHGRFKIGCAMKVLLAILALELANRKTVDLDSPLGRYLPELAISPKGCEITLSHLLSHTSGYRNFDSRYQREAGDACEWSEFLGMLTETAQVFRPGTVFNYQNSESVLLKAVLERAAARTFSELLHEVIFTPLGLAPGPRAEGSGFDIQGHTYSKPERRFVKVDPSERKPKLSFWDPAVSHRTLSLSDWIVIAEALISAHYGEPSPFSMQTTLLLTRRTVDIPDLQGGKLSNALPKASGMGSQLFRNGTAGHDTFVDGQSHGFRIDFKRRIAFAVGINADRPFLRLRATDLVTRMLYGAEPPATPASPLQVPASDLAGTYDCGSSGEAVVGLSGDRLKLTLRNSNSSEHSTFLAIGDDGALRTTDAMSCPSFAFFRDPSSHRVCLMVGTRAFVKT